jgi:hypothetical protein
MGCSSLPLAPDAGAPAKDGGGELADAGPESNADAAALTGDAGSALDAAAGFIDAGLPYPALPFGYGVGETVQNIGIFGFPSGASTAPENAWRAIWTKATVTAWLAAFPAQAAVVADWKSEWKAYYGAVPQGFILIEPQTMKILDIQTGFDLTRLDAAIALHLP